jgi:ATP-dependent DNA helicase RecQ
MGRRPERRDLSRAAKEVLGYPSLRSGQPEALEATLSGRDVLAVMPTGHGKSALHQLPGALTQRADVSTRRVTSAVHLLEQAGALRVRRVRVRAEDVTPARAVRLAVSWRSPVSGCSGPGWT